MAKEKGNGKGTEESEEQNLPWNEPVHPPLPPQQRSSLSSLYQRTIEQAKKLEIKKKEALERIEGIEKEAHSLIEEREEALLASLEASRSSSVKDLSLQKEEEESFLESLSLLLSLSSSLAYAAPSGELCSLLGQILPRLSSLLSTFRSLHPPPKGFSLVQKKMTLMLERALTFQDVISLISPEDSYAKFAFDLDRNALFTNQEHRMTIFPMDANQNKIQKGDFSHQFTILFNPPEKIKVRLFPSLFFVLFRIVLILSLVENPREPER